MRLKSSKALSLVSLATKAGKTASGEFCTEKEVKTGMAELVIVAEDASANTKKKFKNMCDFYEVPIYFYGDKDTLGHRSLTIVLTIGIKYYKLQYMLLVYFICSL